MSSQVHAGGSCSVELFRPLRVTTTTCVAGVHYGLNTTEEVLPDGSRNMRRSMWLAHRKCSGVFRCCNVHVMCVLPDSGWSDHKDPPEFARNGTCSCNKVDLSDTRHLRSREHSCDLVDERSGHGTCIFNQTYGCIPPTHRNSSCSAPPTGGVWARPSCRGRFRVASGASRLPGTLVCGGANETERCTTRYPLRHPPPPKPLPKEGTCIVLNLCWRERFADVYRDRIPRWTSFGIRTYSVDSCTNASEAATAFTTPGVTPLFFAGERGPCFWHCVTVREKVALSFMHEHLPTNCTFVFWASAKYHAPGFAHEFAMIPAATQLVVQFDVYEDRTVPLQTSEIWGVRRELVPLILDHIDRHSSVEHALWKATADLCGGVHRLDQMMLSNISAKRSDGFQYINL
jgi:hypothetical protein